MIRHNKIIAFLLTIVMLCILGSNCLAVEYPCEGVANSKSVRFRKKASSSGDIAGTLELGETVTVFEEIVHNNGNVWYKVQTSKGKQGYVLSDYLSIPEVERIEVAENHPDGKKMKLKVRAGCSDYNHVGKNWTQYFEWNGVKINDSNMEAYAAPDVELSLYARIREQDKKPDTTMDTLLHTPTAEEISNGFQLEQTIKVEENAGNYKGKIAVWKVTYTFTPIN